MMIIKRMKLTGAAILVSRGMKVLQAAPAAYPYRSATESAVSDGHRECYLCYGAEKTAMPELGFQQSTDDARDRP
jgi:galactose-1-phosphate uridylyltransferase